jgi:predicted MFS family arabinose efflux permease
MNRKEWMLMVLLASINFSHILDFMIMMPLGNGLMNSLHINTQQFSWLVSSYVFSAGAASISASFFIDNFDRKKALIFAYSGFLLGTLACVFAESYEELLASRILAGLFGGLIGAQAQSIVADCFIYERRARAMGVFMAGFSVASVIGVPIALKLSTLYGWHAPFALVVSFGAVVLPLLIRYIPNMAYHLNNRQVKHTPFLAIQNVISNKNQRRALLLTFFVQCSHFSIVPFIAPSLEANIGLDRDAISLTYFLGGIFTFFTSPWIGKLADLKGKHLVFSVFAVASCIVLYLFTNLGTSPLVIVYLITTLFFICSSGRFVPMQTLVSSVVMPEHRGGFMNINAFVSQVSSGIGTMLAGAIVVRDSNGFLNNYEYVGYFAITLSLISVFLASRIKHIS